MIDLHEPYNINEAIHTPAFVTGSYAYGVPNADSDIDLVVLMTGQEVGKLVRASGQQAANQYDSDIDYSLRFNKLNVIQLDCPIKYKGWYAANQYLVSLKHSGAKLITREFAKETIVRYIAEFKRVATEIQLTKVKLLTDHL